MGTKTLVLLTVVASVFVMQYVNFCKIPALPALKADPWWGPGKPQKDNAAIRPFKIDVSQQDLEDLETRLSLPLRLTPALEDSNFTYGFHAETLKSVAQHWATKYDWKAREKEINKFPQFKTKIEGLDIHFRHVKPVSTKGYTIVPLLMVHGWPGSILEFDQILPLLTNPQKDSGIVFEVVTPALPGYGFSQASSKQGLRALEMGQIFLKLMKRLGHEKFYVQGGDWGHVIVMSMATYFPENILGMHSNMLVLSTPSSSLKLCLGAVLPSGFMIDAAEEEDVYPLSKMFSFLLEETGYMHIQSTKPDTVGSALNNCPIGLAAYILEKFSTGTQRYNTQKPDGGLLSPDFPISLDRLLDNVSLYWFTRSMTSSMRLYKETIACSECFDIDKIPTPVPTGFTSFKHEFSATPRNFIKTKFSNLLMFRKHEFGGHFAAMELPQVLSEDIYEFVKIAENYWRLKDQQKD